MTEDELLTNVIDLAHFLGAKVAHFRPAKTARGWRTPVQGDGAGFPDLVIVTIDRRVLWRELKSAKGKLSVAQLEWIARLNGAGEDAGMWTPRDFPDRIKAELSAACSRNGVA